MATQAEMDKLRAKGFVVWDIDGVLGRLTKPKRGTTRSASVESKMRSVTSLVGILAAKVKRRAMRGSFADTPQPYESGSPSEHKSRVYFVSPVYASRAGATYQPKNPWRSSSDFHRNAGRFTAIGNVSGAMWRGLEVRGSGVGKASISFGGSSIGSSTYMKTVLRGRKGKKKEVRKMGRLVRNQWKAKALFRSLQINVIAPTQKEINALAVGVEAAALKAVDDVLDSGVAVQSQVLGGPTNADSELVNELLHRWVK